MKKIKNTGKRSGIHDIWWNAFFVKDCRNWCEGDIPECPTAKIEIPADLITWVEAVRIHNKMIKQKKIINIMHISVFIVMIGYSMVLVESGIITTKP